MIDRARGEIATVIVHLSSHRMGEFRQGRIVDVQRHLGNGEMYYLVDVLHPSQDWIDRRWLNEKYVTRKVSCMLADRVAP